MKYRKYRAKSFQEAKLKMLLDVGHHAYIVSQKRVRVGGFLGLFGKAMVEITAGVIESQERRRLAANANERVDPSRNIDRAVNTNYTKEHKGYSAIVSNSTQKENTDSKTENLSREINEIKSLITMILADRSTNKDNTSVHNATKSTIETKVVDDRDKARELIGRGVAADGREQTRELIKLFMKEEDFNDSFIEDLCSLSSVQFLLSNEKKLSIIKDRLREQISEVINTSDGIKLKDGRTNVIVLVGPTGVGKTTTLAKLAAYFGVFQKKKVKLVSIDTYRVGAIQQLKLYADIMEIPFAKVNNIREFKMELNMDNYDLILIDTTGRSQRNTDEIRDIKKYLDIIEHNLYVSLVISATTKYIDIVEILDKFDILNYSNIIVTKLDETNSLGQVISAIRPKNRSLAYVTFGQSVPEDIEEATKNKIFDMVLKG